VIATNHEEPVQLLLDRFQKLEGEFARVQNELQDLKIRLATIVPVKRKGLSFQEAADQVHTEYADLLQRLSQ
jgi:hypothetical protein